MGPLRLIEGDPTASRRRSNSIAIVGLDGDGDGTPSVNVTQVESIQTSDRVHADLDGDAKVNASDLGLLPAVRGDCLP